MLPLLLGKPLIVVPRLKKFKEHTDDHQLQIVQELERQKKIIAVYDVKNLGSAIKKAKKFKPKKLQRENRISTIIENYLKKQEGKA
jgi:UDP-N-acetylglucosamine transferase subunit ALG13